MDLSWFFRSFPPSRPPGLGRDPFSSSRIHPRPRQGCALSSGRPFVFFFFLHRVLPDFPPSLFIDRALSLVLGSKAQSCSGPSHFSAVQKPHPPRKLPISQFFFFLVKPPLSGSGSSSPFPSAGGQNKSFLCAPPDSRVGALGLFLSLSVVRIPGISP